MSRPEPRREQNTRSPGWRASSSCMSRPIELQEEPEHWLKSGLPYALEQRPQGWLGPSGSIDIAMLSGVPHCFACLWQRGVLVFVVRRSLPTPHRWPSGVTGCGCYTRHTLCSELSRSLAACI